MDGEPIVSTDSAPASEAATVPTDGQADTTAEVTHGGEDAAPAPTDQPTDAEPDDAEAEESDSPNDTEEERKTKAEKRRERRIAREQQRIDAAVKAALDAEKSAAATKAAQDKAEAEAKAASKQWADQFGALVGTPEARTKLAQEIDALVAEVEALRPDSDTFDLDVLDQKQRALAAKRAERSRLDAGQQLYDQLDGYQLELTKAQCAAQASKLPAEHQAKYLASGSFPQLLDNFEAGIVARERAAHAAELAKLRAELTGELEREKAEHAATRTGAPGSGAVPNGSNGSGSGGGLPSFERYNAMTFEERRKLTPAQRDEILSRHFATAGRR